MLTEQQTEVCIKSLFVKSHNVSVFLRAVNNRFRQQILHILEEHKRLSVTEIIIKAGQMQSVTSQHLAILRRTGLVKTSRMGKHIYYELNHNRLHQIHELIDNMFGAMKLKECDVNAYIATTYDKYEIDYLQQRTGATTDEIYDAKRIIGNNWVNIIYYLKHKSHNLHLQVL